MSVPDSIDLDATVASLEAAALRVKRERDVMLRFVSGVARLTEYGDDATVEKHGEDAIDSVNSLIGLARYVLAKMETAA